MQANKASNTLVLYLSQTNVRTGSIKHTPVVSHFHGPAMITVNGVFFQCVFIVVLVVLYLSGLVSLR